MDFIVGYPAVLVVLLALAAWRLSKVGRRPPGTPPGPPTLPLLGNLHQMPRKDAHVQFQKWAEEYGPLFSLMLGTQPAVILSSDTAVKDLLDKKGNIYSDRPDMFIAQNIASGGHRLVIMRYGDTWRTIHKLVHNILNITVASKYIPYQDLENKFLLEGLLDSPQQLENHLKRFSYSVSTQIIFGFRCPSATDPKLARLFYTVNQFGKVSASDAAQLTDCYPIMQKLPHSWLPAVSEARQIHEVGRDVFVSHWLDAKKHLENGTGVPCICNDLLLAQKSESLSDEQVGYIVGYLLEGGSDTTSSTMLGFIQAMMVWPDVQKKAQEEIDRVVGPNRLPNVDDYPNMPYIRCCIKETLRWMPTVILGVPHRNTQEDVYNGWRIPKDTTMIINVWGIHMDPARSPEPRRFNPDRYAGDETTLYQSANGEPLLRDNFNFGAGRRLCQGIHIAERSLFLGMSRILWGFNLEAPLDSQGQRIVPNVDDLVGGITVHPAPFGINIVPKSTEREQIMRNAVKDCEKLLNPATGQWKEVPEGMVFGAWKPRKE